MKFRFEKFKGICIIFLNILFINLIWNKFELIFKNKMVLLIKLKGIYLRLVYVMCLLL